MDIGIFFDGTQFDIGVEKGDLIKDEGLETAVIISLFTDQRVTIEELPDLIENQKGWWGDAITEIDGDQIGSKLWLLSASKNIDENIGKYETYCNDALQWMIDDGLAQNVSTVAEFSENGILLSIDIEKSPDESLNYSYLWDGQKAKRG